jgi:hypothetical protein
LQRELPAILSRPGHAYGHIQVSPRWPQPDLSHRQSAARPPHVILGWRRAGRVIVMIRVKITVGMIVSGFLLCPLSFDATAGPAS